MPRGVNDYDAGMLQGRNVANANSVSVVSPGLITDGLVLHLNAGNFVSYPAAGTTWRDLSNSNFTGALVGAPTFSSANGGIINFDGVNGYALITNPAEIRNQNFTVSIWINPKTQFGAVSTVVDFDHALGDQGWVIQSEDALTNRFYYLAWFDGTAFQPAGQFGAGKGIQITPNVWQNLTYVKNGATVVGYKNEASAWTPTVGGSANVTYIASRNLAISDAINQATRNFNSDFGAVRIYNRALTPTEVEQNFNATRARFGV